MAAIPINLKLEKGADFSAIFFISDEYGQYLNLSSYNVSASYSSSYTSSNKQNFSINIIEPLNGKIELKLSAAQTAQLKLPRYVYDILIIAPISIGGTKTRVVEGVLEISPGVTQ